MWASDHYAIEPDVIASAKALRVGATISRSEVFPSEKNRLGSTFGGGDVLGSMMGALTLEAIQEHDLLANATRRGRQAKEILRRRARHRRGRARQGADARGGVRHGRASRRRRRGVPRPRTPDARLRDEDDTSPSPLDATEREIALGTGIFLDAIDAVSASATAT